MTQEFEHQAGSTPQPPGSGTGFVFPARAALVRTSDTIINPERRAAVESSVELLPLPSSALCGLLFPNPEAIQQAIPNPAGVELGHFRIQSAIRSGGMGAVFQALDTRLNRIVALKVLPPSQSRDVSAVQRFRNEAQAAAQLDHDNIARVYYIGEDKALHFIAFEYIRGTNLREIVQKKGRLTPSEAVNYTLQVASALAHAAEHGVVHRDIKPSNIIIMPSGRAKLVDLGLARSEHRENEPDLTIAGTTLGTFDYISPEQAKDPRTVDVRSDIYSLGCTIYHLLTGEPPYPQGTVLQKLLDHQGKDAPDPRLKNRRVSPELAMIVKTMMASDARKRYQTAGELIRDLLFVANSLGLKSVNSEGLMWMSLQNSRDTFWERNASWLAMGVCLLLFVGYLHFYSPQNTKSQLALNQSSAAISEFGPFEDGRRNQAKSIVQAESTSGTGIARETTSERPNGSGNQTQQTAANSNTGTIGAAVPTLTPSTTNDNRRPAQGLVGSNVSIAQKVSERPGELNSLNSKFPASFDPDELENFEPISVTATANANKRPASESPEKDVNSGKTSSEKLAGANGEIPGTAVATIATPDTRVSVTNSKSPLDAILRSPIVVIKSDGTPEPFPTLEAACAAAQDGNVIELRFNGLRSESPVRIRSKITIRAGKSFRPVIEFVPKDIPAAGFETRMITLSGGSLDLVDVGVLIAVKETINADVWALISTRRTDAVSLQRVTITVQNPSKRPAAVLELRGGASRMVNDMEMPGSTNQMGTGMTVRVADSLIRGGTDLFHVKTMLSARLDVENCLLALEGAVLRQVGSMDPPERQTLLDLRLYQLTAVVNSGLIVMDAGDAPRQLGPVAIDAQNNIFTSVTTINKPVAPLIEMTGNEPADDMRKLISWKGQKNFYDGFQAFWTVRTMLEGPRTSVWDFIEWKFRLEGIEIDPHGAIVVWKAPWSIRPLWDLAPSDFALDENAQGNPALSAANNGENAGVNLATLEKLNVSVRAETADRSN